MGLASWSGTIVRSSLLIHQELSYSSLACRRPRPRARHEQQSRPSSSPPEPSFAGARLPHPGHPRRRPTAGRSARCSPPTASSVASGRSAVRSPTAPSTASSTRAWSPGEATPPVTAATGSCSPPTPAGRRVAKRWLDAPVQHLRDVRTELLVKLALRDRAGLDNETAPRRPAGGVRARHRHPHLDPRGRRPRRRVASRERPSRPSVPRRGPPPCRPATGREAGAAAQRPQPAARHDRRRPPRRGDVHRQGHARRRSAPDGGHHQGRRRRPRPRSRRPRRHGRSSRPRSWWRKRRDRGWWARRTGPEQGATMHLSARNQLNATVETVTHGEVMSTVKVVLPDGQHITAAITKDATEELAFAPGDAVVVVIKVDRGHAGQGVTGPSGRSRDSGRGEVPLDVDVGGRRAIPSGTRPPLACYCEPSTVDAARQVEITSGGQMSACRSSVRRRHAWVGRGSSPACRPALRSAGPSPRDR